MCFAENDTLAEGQIRNFEPITKNFYRYLYLSNKSNTGKMKKTQNAVSASFKSVKEFACKRLNWKVLWMKWAKKNILIDLFL